MDSYLTTLHVLSRVWYLILLLSVFARWQEHPDWETKNGCVFFQKAKESQPSKEIPSLQLINQTLSYARELERIVWKSVWKSNCTLLHSSSFTFSINERTQIQPFVSQENVLNFCIHLLDISFVFFVSNKLFSHFFFGWSGNYDYTIWAEIFFFFLKKK